jgi:hypothetical protein
MPEAVEVFHDGSQRCPRALTQPDSICPERAVSVRETGELQQTSGKHPERVL